MISAHTIIDSTPSTVSRVTGPLSERRHHRHAKGVERARADVAIDHADAAERERPETARQNGFRRPPEQAGGRIRLQFQSWNRASPSLRRKVKGRGYTPPR